jgi:hypothetical protein
MKWSDKGKGGWPRLYRAESESESIRRVFPLVNVVMNDLGPSKHHLTSSYQLIKLIWLTRLVVMFVNSSVSSDKELIIRVISVTRQSKYLPSERSCEYCFSRLRLAC